MLSFEMTLATAVEFYERKKALGAVTEEECLAILLEMTHEGLIERITQTERTKEQYVADLQKNYDVLDLTEKPNEPKTESEADSGEAGEDGAEAETPN